MSDGVTPASDADRQRLHLRGLNVEVAAPGLAIVDGIDLDLAPGEILGLVGESGSGKTTTALSLLGYSTGGAWIRAGRLEIAGAPMTMDESMRSLRGAVIAYVPQDPSGALNPAMRIGRGLTDVLGAHRGHAATDAAVARLLEAVGLPSSPEFAARFPHQLSGGQQQRVAIAMALSCDPAVIVLDEPTTGLDVVTQERILTELTRLRDERGISMVYVTHDLAVVAQIADRIAVMYSGRVVEQGPAHEVLRRPRHPYTRGLLTSIPDHVRLRALEPMPGITVSIAERPLGCAFAPRCPQRSERCVAEPPPMEEIEAHRAVRCFHWGRTPAVESRPLAALHPAATSGAVAPLLVAQNIRVEHHSRREVVVAADGIDFEVEGGACVALVGESGSGKTTIARAIVGLHPIAGGEVRLDGAPLPSLARKRTAEQRRRVQYVAQNPASALNPRHTVGDSIARPARVLRGLSRQGLADEVRRLLESVRLPAAIVDRYPAELSGGERQRVAIARALAAGPELILCDEITSALDVSVQAAVLELLGTLRRELGLSLLFITHDLGVVAHVADEVLVLEKGAICERGPVARVLADPEHPYTQRLLVAAPSVSRAVQTDEILHGGAPARPAA
jgi:peptide/nickel transport system ATP-binding protein